MLQGQMAGLLNFVCQVFLAPLQNSLTFSNQPNGQERLHIPFPCTWAEAIWQILCARATFSLPVSAFRLFQSPITGEMNFWEQPSFPLMATCCAPSLSVYELAAVPAFRASCCGLSLSIARALPLLCWRPAISESAGFLPLCTHGGEENRHKHGWYSNKWLCEGSQTYCCLDISYWPLQQTRGGWLICVGLQGSFC